MSELVKDLQQVPEDDLLSHFKTVQIPQDCPNISTFCDLTTKFIANMRSIFESQSFESHSFDYRSFFNKFITLSSSQDFAESEYSAVSRCIKQYLFYLSSSYQDLLLSESSNSTILFASLKHDLDKFEELVKLFAAL